MQFINFYFQLIEISFLFVESITFLVIALYNLLISRNQIQLNEQCNVCLKEGKLKSGNQSFFGQNSSQDS